MGALIYILDDRIIGNDKSNPPKMTISMLNHNLCSLKDGEEWHLGITHERVIDTSIQHEKKICKKRKGN